MQNQRTDQRPTHEERRYASKTNLLDEPSWQRQNIRRNKTNTMSSSIDDRIGRRRSCGDLYSPQSDLRSLFSCNGVGAYSPSVESPSIATGEAEGFGLELNSEYSVTPPRRCRSKAVICAAIAAFVVVAAGSTVGIAYYRSESGKGAGVLTKMLSYLGIGPDDVPDDVSEEPTYYPTYYPTYSPTEAEDAKSEETGEADLFLSMYLDELYPMSMSPAGVETKEAKSSKSKSGKSKSRKRDVDEDDVYYI